MLAQLKQIINFEINTILCIHNNNELHCRHYRELQGVSGQIISQRIFRLLCIIFISNSSSNITSLVGAFSFIFYFFNQKMVTTRALASFRILLQTALSLATFHQFFIPNFLTSSSTSSIHRRLGLPTLHVLQIYFFNFIFIISFPTCL